MRNPVTPPPLRYFVVLDGVIVAVFGRALAAEAQAKFDQVSELAIGTNSEVHLVARCSPLRCRDPLPPPYDWKDTASWPSSLSTQPAE